MDDKKIISNVPKLSCSKDSVQAVNSFVASYKGDNYALIEKLIAVGIQTAFTLHNNLNELLALVGAKDRFSTLEHNKKNKLVNRYLWSHKVTQSKERQLTNLKQGTYKTLPTFDNAFDFKQMIAAGGFYSLNARMGTGKTQYVGKPFCQAARELGYTPIVIAHRVALIGELSSKTNTVHYEAVKLDEQQDIKSGLAVCINSLSNKRIQSALRKTNGKYVLFIDEYSQTLYNFDSSTFKKAEAATVLDVFCDLIKNAQAVIVADADINDYSRNIVETIRKQQSESFFVDKDNSNVNVNITLQHGKGYDFVDLQFGQIAEHLDKGGKAVFYSNRNKICQALRDFIRMHYPEKNTLLVCSHTEHDPKAKAFKANAETEAKKYDLIIISPTITSGVSVVDSDYQTSFSVFDASTLTHLEAIQQMHRFRCVTTHNMILMTKGVNTNKASFTLQQVQTELKYSDNELNVKGHIDRLIKKVKDDKQVSQDNFSQFIISRLKDLGYNLNIHDDIVASMAFDVESHIKGLNEAEFIRVLNAKRLTYAEYNELKQKETITDDEHTTIVHFDICQALNLPNGRMLTGELLEIYGDKGRGISAIRKNAMVFDGIDVDFMEDNEIKNNLPLNKRRLPRHVKNLAKQYLAAIFGREIGLAELMNLSQPLTFQKSSLNKFARLVEQTAPLGVIAGLLSSRRVKRDYSDKTKETYITTPVEESGYSPLAKDFLLHIGLLFKSTGRIRTNGNDEYIYSVNIDNLMVIYELLGYQSDKTKELKRLHDEKITALNGVKSNIDKSIDDLNEQELSTLEMFVTATINEYDQVEKGSYSYSCPKCYTPTNNYTCSCCGAHELTKLINIHAISRNQIRNDIFNALKFNIIEV